MQSRNPLAHGRYQQGKALTITLVIFALLAVLVLSLPTLLSSGPGTRVLVGFVDRAVPGSVELDELSLGWFTGQRLGGVRLLDPEDEQVLTLATLRTEMTLLQAVRGRLSLGETRLSGLQADLRMDDQGALNLNRALGLDPTEPEPAPGPLVIPVTGNMILEQATITWSAPGMEQVAIEDLQAQVRLDRVTRALDFRLDGTSQMPGGSGTLHARGELRDWLTEAGQMDLGQASLEARVRLESLPLQLVDGLAGLDGLLLEALGDRLTLVAEGTESALEIEATAPYLELSLAAALQDLQLSLQRAGSVSWQLRPQLLEKLLPRNGEEPLRLREAVTLQLELARLDLPLRGFDPSQVAVRGTLSGDRALRWQGGGLDDLEIRDLAAEIDSDSLAAALQLALSADVRAEQRTGELRANANVTDLFAADGRLQQEAMTVDADAHLRDLPTALIDRLAGMDGLLVTALGSRLNLEAAARTEAAGRIDASLSLDSARLQVEPLRLTLADDIRLQQSARVRYQLRLELLRTLAPGGGFELTGDSRLELTLSELSLPWPQAGEPMLQPERSRLRAALTSSPIELTDAEGVRHRLEQLRADLGGESLGELRLTGESRLHQSEPGLLYQLDAVPLQLHWEADTGLVEGGPLKQIVLDLRGESGDLKLAAPLRIAGDFSRVEMRSPVTLELPMTRALHPAAPELIGPLLSLSVDGAVDLGEVVQGNLGVRVRSEYLRSDLALQLGETLRLQRPAELQWNLTPAAHEALQAEAAPPRLLLEEPLALQLALNRLVMPLGDAMSGRMPDLEARLDVADGRLRKEDSELRYRLRDFGADLATASSGTAVNLRLNGRVSEVDGPAGELTVQARLAELFEGPEGAFDLGAMALDLDARLNQLPVPVLDSFMGMDGLLTATLGDQVEGRAQGEIRAGNGPLEVSLRSPNARIDMRARTEDGVLGLRETMVAEIAPTEEFGRAVLARVHPLFETLRGGEQPIRLSIPADGVALPWAEFAIDQVRIPELDLRLGELELASGWLLQGLVNLGQRFGTMRSVGDRWRAEFTPAVLQLSDGKLDYKRRLDVLLGDQLHLATWGTVDLAEQRMDLVLGLMPTTLATMFRIDVPENDALRIPVRGEQGSGSIDFSRAGSELARLQAQRQLGSSNPLLGALAGALGGSSPGLTGAPEPSVSPLPWAERMARRAAEAEEEATSQ